MFDFYPTYEENFAQVQLILFMLGMGVTLKVDDFAGIFRQPRSLIVALLGQVILSPLIAVLVNHLFGLSGGIALGLILTSAMPGGALAKAFVFLGRGNAPLAISLTVVSTLAAVVTVPLTLEIFATLPAGFEMPVLRIVRDVVCYLLAPLGAGMYLGSINPHKRKTLSRWFIRVGFVVVLAMIVCALGSRRIAPGDHGWLVPIAIVVFSILCMQANMLPFRLGGWSRADMLSAGIEVTMRNMNLALLLKASMFPESGPSEIAKLGREVMFVVLFYAGVAMGTGLPLALNFLRIAKRDESKRGGKSIGVP